MKLPGSETIDGEVAISADGKTVAYSGQNAIAIFDTDSARILGSVKTSSEGWLKFSDDGSKLIGFPRNREREGICLIGNVRTNPREVPLEGISSRRLFASFSRDGKTLAIGGFDQAVGLWDSATGRKQRMFPFRSSHVRCLEFTPDGQTLLFSCEDGRLRSWRVEGDVESPTSLAAHDAEVWSLKYTSDGSSLISSGDDRLIKIWSPAPASGPAHKILSGHGALVSALAVSPDDETLASGSFDRTVRLWDLPTGKLRAVLEGHTESVRAVAYSRDSRIIASAGSDKTVRSWNNTTASPLQIFKGHTATVRSIAFHPDGKILVSAGDDMTIRVWNLTHGSNSVRSTAPSATARWHFPLTEGCWLQAMTGEA